MKIYRYLAWLIAILCALSVFVALEIGSEKLGVEESLLLFLGVLLLILGILTIRDWRIRRAIATITVNDGEAIKYVGSQRQSSMALEIGNANGWIGSYVNSDNDNIKIVSFNRGEDATSATDFLKALYQANLVSRKLRRRSTE